MRDKRKLQVLIIAIVVAVSGIFIYKGAVAPKLYDKYLNVGIKYLEDGQYEEAILAFDKAIKIEPKTTEARVHQAKAYVGNNESNKAVNVLEEAQNIDITNEDLLQQILDILNEIDTEIAYEFLDRFVEAVGKDNASQDIKEMLDSANELPIEPVADPAPGKYINPIAVKLKFDEIKMGHTYYYTLDGSQPSKSSNKYAGQIEIVEDTTIKIVGYNKKNDSTDVVTLGYSIDSGILEDVKSSIDKGETLINDTTVGSEVGNVSKKDKQKLQSTISKANELLNKDSVAYNDVDNMKTKVESAIKEFKNNIVKPTDKSKLKSAISKAQNLYDKSAEGSNVGQYKSGSKSVLLKAINKAKNIYNKSDVKQEVIDSSVLDIQQSIKKFENSKIKPKKTTSKNKPKKQPLTPSEERMVRKKLKDEGYASEILIYYPTYFDENYKDFETTGFKYTWDKIKDYYHLFAYPDGGLVIVHYKTYKIHTLNYYSGKIDES